MMKTSVCKSFSFDAAHHLPNYDGPCANNHGHRWNLQVEVTGAVGETSGMVIDFSILKAIMKPLIDRLDHKDLNDIIPNPTCENLLEFISKYLKSEFKDIEAPYKPSRLRLNETPDSFAEVKLD